MEQEKEKIIRKFELLSSKYHKLSLLFYELSQSLKINSRDKSVKDFKKYIKEELNLDWDKIKAINKDLVNIQFSDLKKDKD